MDQEHSNSDQSDNQNQQFAMDLVPLQDKYEKVLNLNTEVRLQIEDITRKAIRKPLLNGHIDPKNEARPFTLTVSKENIKFKNFMTKMKNQAKRKQTFSVIRDILEEKGYNNVVPLNQRQQRSVMVVRFINKVENQDNVMEIEDDLSKERQKIVVRQGIAYVGLICAIQAVYENQMYRLEKIIDLSPSPKKVQQLPDSLSHPLMAYRVLFTKGPFWENDSKENIGIQLIVNELESLRYKENIRVDLLVVMGPLLSQQNEHVKNFTLERTFEEEVDEIIETLKRRCEKVLPDIQIVMMPSTDDVVSLYPIPQPAYELRTANLVKFVSNPGRIQLRSNKPQCQLSLINYDLITYIDKSKCGRSIRPPLIQNIETYLKQPFLMTNTLDDSPFDETNFSGLFNENGFGDVIVMSSQRHPVFVHKVKDNKVFVNIGSLGLDFHSDEKHFMALMSLYDGEGEVAERIRVDSIVMEGKRSFKRQIQ